jgi:hypothetical protein
VLSGISIETRLLKPPNALNSSLIVLCEIYGWSEFADEVIDALNKLCLYNVDIALALVEK